MNGSAHDGSSGTRPEHHRTDHSSRWRGLHRGAVPTSAPRHPSPIHFDLEQSLASHGAGLGKLRLALELPALFSVLELVYFLGEYAFASLLASGFALYPDGLATSIPRRRWPWVLACIWAICLTRLSSQFLVGFSLHALVLAVLLARAVRVLSRVRLPPSQQWARLFAVASLSALTLDFFLNGGVQLVLWYNKGTFDPSYSAYHSIVDLIIEVLVGFGMIAIAAVDMRLSFDAAQASTQSETDRLSMLAHHDALTGCFNRLALEELKSRIGNRRGSVALIDMNGLKQLNDEQGHAAGDLAICHLANALKNMLRQHDHVFRIGGDEFVLVTFDLAAAEASARLGQVSVRLRAANQAPERIGPIGIAFGVAEFTHIEQFDAAVAEADARMYEDKRNSKQRAGEA